MVRVLLYLNIFIAFKCPYFTMIMRASTFRGIRQHFFYRSWTKPERIKKKIKQNVTAKLSLDSGPAPVTLYRLLHTFCSSFIFANENFGLLYVNDCISYLLRWIGKLSFLRWGNSFARIYFRCFPLLHQRYLRNTKKRESERG